jgi:hypothetical protein
VTQYNVLGYYSPLGSIDTTDYMYTTFSYINTVYTHVTVTSSHIVLLATGKSYVLLCGESCSIPHSPSSLVLTPVISVQRRSDKSVALTFHAYRASRYTQDERKGTRDTLGSGSRWGDVFYRVK